MTTSALTVAILIAWPTINILLGSYAAWLATRDERRREREASGDTPGSAGDVMDTETWSLIAPSFRQDTGLAGLGLAERRTTDVDPVDSFDWWNIDRNGYAEPIDATTPGGAPRDFWIVVPCLNEERVIGNTVMAALDLVAPDGHTRVLVVDDASDDRTPEVLAGIENPRLHVLRRELPLARQGKGHALNAAYGYISNWARQVGADPSQVVVGVIDGDGRGSDNLLAEVAEVLTDARIGAVQARVRIHNRNRLLGAVQDLEFACVADASQMLRARIGSVGLGGNGQFTRLSTLQRLGSEPWSDCLVEDLELGLRLHLKGIGIGYVWRASITQQGVVDVRRLLRQRTRWAQGNLQCIRYLPRLAMASSIRVHTFLEMAYYLLAPWLNAFGSAAIVGLCGYLVVLLATDGGSGIAGPVIGTGLWLVALTLPGLSWAVMHRLRLRDERLGRCLMAGLAYPALLLLGLVSTWRAVARQILGRNGWAKTERLVEEPGTPFRSSSLPWSGPQSVSS